MFEEKQTVKICIDIVSRNTNISTLKIINVLKETNSAAKNIRLKC